MHIPQKLHLHGGMNMNGLHYILAGEQRKQMAQVISEIIQEKVVYKRVPPVLPNWFLHHQQGRSPKLDRLNAAKKELGKDHRTKSL